MGKIVYLLGKSASGKDSIYNGIMKSGLNIKPVVPYTTRPRREGETEGEEYYFIDDTEFELLKSEGKLIEYREYHTMQGIWRYMTVGDGQINLEKNSSLLIGTLESYKKTREYYGEDKLIPIYLTVDDGERLQRALNRERQQRAPKYAELCRRFLADEADFSQDNLISCGISLSFKNDDYEMCLREIVEYLKNRL